MEHYKSYGPAGVEISRPPVMSIEQMQRCLLQVIDSNEIIYLPTGRIQSFDDMREWVGWTQELRPIFDTWAASNSKKAVSTRKWVPGHSTCEFRFPDVTL